MSFDGNYRPKLWATWNDRPAPLLHALLAEADIAFIDHRDVDLVLGAEGDAVPAGTAVERTLAAAARAQALPIEAVVPGLGGRIEQRALGMAHDLFQ